MPFMVSLYATYLSDLFGVLMCGIKCYRKYVFINGTQLMYEWFQNNIGVNSTYEYKKLSASNIS